MRSESNTPNDNHQQENPQHHKSKATTTRISHGDLPTLSYAEAERIVDKFLKALEIIITALQTIILGLFLLWYLPIYKDKGYYPSITLILFLIYAITLLRYKKEAHK